MRCVAHYARAWAAFQGKLSKGWLSEGVNEIYQQIPEQYRNIIAMLQHERSGKPIILKNGARAYPKGWLRLFKCS